MRKFNSITDLYVKNTANHVDIVSLLGFVDILEIMDLITTKGQFTGLHIPYKGLSSKFINLIDAGCLANPKKVTGEGDIDYVLYHDIYFKAQDESYTKVPMSLKSTFEKVLINDQPDTVWMKSEMIIINRVTRAAIDEAIKAL
ncbi:hypothetical protein [Pontibacter arcticus]|uniref:Uncharacterized protein n=1 Tax=Pontibacter arcticus TaxID=2080288 RepID=A0A364RIG1_9BACT|nr:hypothetical protein [Pontibacter arcticus]RAU84063.1 hypothetical protein DP923_03150 [Pontibacter arcticus]